MKARMVTFIGGPLADTSVNVPDSAPNRAAIPIYRVVEGDESDVSDINRAPGKHLYLRTDKGAEYIYIMCTS